MAGKGKVAEESQIAALRKVAEARLVRLENKAQKLRGHLNRKPGDLQAMHYLLHKVAVEQHDIRQNLKNNPEWTPQPKRKKEKRTIPDSTPIPPRTKGDPGTPKNYKIQSPVPLPTSRIPDNQKNMDRGSGGRSWCSPPFVEVALPPGKEQLVIRRLAKFKIDEHNEVVRLWAERNFGSIEEAKAELRKSATLPQDANAWRELIAHSKKATEFKGKSDDGLLQDASARRIATEYHQIEWVRNIRKAILDAAPQGVSKDALSSKLNAHLKSFHTAVNSFKQQKNKQTGEVELVTKHPNPQFPYLAQEKPILQTEAVAAEVIEWLQLQVEDRFKKDEKDPKKRGRVTVLQQKIGAAKRAKHRRGTEKTLPWAGKPHWKGTLYRKREAALVWDIENEQLALALPTGGQTPIDPDKFIYLDGSQLNSDGQLLTAKRGKSAFVMPLIPKHDFLRWYTKHVENHNPHAPLHKRCVHNTTQFVVIPGNEKRPPRLFIRPVFKFYDPVNEIPDSHTWNKKPACRYLIGIDRGINSPYFAVVYDSQANSITHVRSNEGRKEEWINLRNELAAAQRERDRLLNEGAKRKRIKTAQDKIRRLRKRERGLNKVETVEAIAELADWAENTLGRGNYCFVIEKLQPINLKRNNRIKHIAAIKEALVNQMRKKGYRYRDKTGRVDGVREESPWYTSKVSPFGWWAKPEEIEKTKLPVGRKVGKDYCFDAENGIHKKGAVRKPNGKGRAVFVLHDEDLKTGIRRRNFGSQLFWDPNQKQFKGRSFPHGIILNADFVGAFNIALRPIVKHGQNKGFTAQQMAEAHTKLNPTVTIECDIPLYEFVEVDGNPYGGIRRVRV